MRVLELMDRKAIGIGFAVNVAVWILGLLIVGMDPSDTEMSLIFGLAFTASVVAAVIILRPGARGS